MTIPWWDEYIDTIEMSAADWLEINGTLKTDKQLAEEISTFTDRSVTIPAVRQKRQSMGVAKPMVRFKQSSRQRFDGYIRVTTDNILVISDLHIQFHDPEWLGAVVNFAVRKGIKILIIAGDLIDFEGLSPFPRPTRGNDTEQPSNATELQCVQDILKQLVLIFDEVIILLGNHEERLARKLGDMTTSILGTLFGINGTCARISEYHFCVVETSDEQLWRITHPHNASSLSVRVASKLADKYGQNIVVAHGHDWGVTTSASGHYVAACGVIADPSKIEYVSTKDSTYPFMQQGAWALVDGAPIILHPKWAHPDRY